MRFIQINQPSDPSLTFIRNLYETSFPLYERRTWENFLLALSSPDMQLFLLTEEHAAGFVITWKLEDFLYIEHFAISPNLRGKQYGGKVLDSILALSNGKVILEVEHEHDEDSKRRISFYTRKGFHKAFFTYMQPPYRNDAPSHPMLIMAVPEISTEEEFKKITDLIRMQVYEQFY
jgi:ribosomal protein S18 acetylase RimI-like enzyme